VRERDAEHRAGTDAKFSRRFAHRQAAPASLTEARSRFAERIEGRPAIAALRAANAVVLVSFDDLAAHVAGNLAQLTFLVGRGLIDGRDPQIENSAFHRKKALVFDAGTIAHLRVKKHHIFDAEMPSA